MILLLNALTALRRIYEARKTGLMTFFSRPYRSSTVVVCRLSVVSNGCIVATG